MIVTDRLLLRGWLDEDEAAFGRVTNTPAVMAHLGGVAPREAIAGRAARMREQQRRDGMCFWIVERRSDRDLLGFCGLQRGTVGAVAGEIEIGWRLRADAWRGYAREGATACLDWGFTTLGAPRIRAITVVANERSRNLMARLGMARRADLDFDHPRFAPGHPLCRHVVYEAASPG